MSPNLGNQMRRFKTILRIIPFDPVGGEKQALPPPPNESSYFDQILSIGLQDFMSLKIYILADFWEIFFFRPEISAGR